MKKGSGKKPGNEEKMYPVVRDYLSRAKGCKQVFMDSIESSENRIHLPRGLCKRDPDIIAIHNNGRIFIAEGKLLSRSGKAFEECIEQLESLRQFGDFFYAFIPKTDWEKLTPADVTHYKDILHEKGFGLLLVDISVDCEECLEKIPPQLNKKIDQGNKAILNRYFNDQK